MGIDVYMRWPGQTTAEKKAQYTGFSVTDGHAGYLREAYHGGPYVTQFLVREGFESDEGSAEIPAKVLRERLPAACMIAIYREDVVYKQGADPAVINLDNEGEEKIDGVDLPQALMDHILAALTTAKTCKGEGEQIAATLTEEQIRATSALIEARRLPDFVLSFVDFVALAERKEKEIGKPVTIEVSA